MNGWCNIRRTSPRAQPYWLYIFISFLIRCGLSVRRSIFVILLLCIHFVLSWKMYKYTAYLYRCRYIDRVDCIQQTRKRSNCLLTSRWKGILATHLMDIRRESSICFSTSFIGYTAQHTQRVQQICG